MGELTYSTPRPKPVKGPTARARAKKLRMASATIRTVRAVCVERDGYCRLMEGAHAMCCAGRSEWAHMTGFRRYQTAGQAPEQRHQQAHSLMLCRKHHDQYDDRELTIEPITDQGADGLLRIICDTREVIV